MDHFLYQGMHLPVPGTVLFVVHAVFQITQYMCKAFLVAGSILIKGYIMIVDQCSPDSLQRPCPLFHRVPFCPWRYCSQAGIFWTENAVWYSGGSRFCRFGMRSIGKIRYWNEVRVNSNRKLYEIVWDVRKKLNIYQGDDIIECGGNKACHLHICTSIQSTAFWTVQIR